MQHFGNKYMRQLLRALLLVVLGKPFAWAYPSVGSSAPALEPMTLLQAPAGARLDWPGLRGKVVVLEFWATWCSPCVASLPHFDELVESLDPTKFQFISIDDEDLKTVQTFLIRKKMLGWVGVDRSGGVFASYAVNARPTTFIIDAAGKVVAITDIESVNAADLRAVAEGRPVAFKPAFEVTKMDGAMAVGGSDTLFAVSVAKAAAEAKMTTVEHAPTGTDFLGDDADSLFTDAFDAFGGRYVLKSALPDGRFDLRENTGGLPAAQVTPIVQQAVLAALHLQIEPRTITKRAYVLRATAASGKLLSPSASSRHGKRGYWHGRYILMNGTMDDLAYVLATGLETPVLNQTGIGGNYDARFVVARDDIDSVNAVLRTTLGLELVQSEQELPITVQEVSHASSAPTTATPDRTGH